ncbi:MAG: cache domain-containing protein, partial [bacterium]
MKQNLIIIALTVVVLVTVIFLAFDLHQASKEKLVSNFTERQLLMARRVASEIESYLRARSQGIEILSSFVSLQNHDMKQMAADIQAHFEYLKEKYVKAMSVYNETGTIIYSTNENAIGLNYGQCEFFHWASKKENRGKVFVSPLIRISASGEPPPYVRSLLL